MDIEVYYSGFWGAGKKVPPHTVTDQYLFNRCRCSAGQTCRPTPLPPLPSPPTSLTGSSCWYHNTKSCRSAEPPELMAPGCKHRYSTVYTWLPFTGLTLPHPSSKVVPNLNLLSKNFLFKSILPGTYHHTFSCIFWVGLLPCLLHVSCPEIQWNKCILSILSQKS